MENITEEQEPQPEELPGEYFFTKENKKNTRPAVVSKAIKLVISTAALGIIYIVSDTLTSQRTEAFYFAIAVVCILGAASTAYLITKIRAGANGARTILTLFFVIGMVQAPSGIPKIFAKNQYLGVLYLVEIAVQLLAIFLLYKKESNAWFRLKD